MSRGSSLRPSYAHGWFVKTSLASPANHDLWKSRPSRHSCIEPMCRDREDVPLGAWTISVEAKALVIDMSTEVFPMSYMVLFSFYQIRGLRAKGWLWCPSASIGSVSKRIEPSPDPLPGFLQHV